MSTYLKFTAHSQAAIVASIALLVSGCANIPLIDRTIATGSGVDTQSLAAEATSLPATEIVIAPLRLSSDHIVGSWVIRTENPGYENQPWFEPGRHSFFYVAEGESGKTDIWRVDLTDKLERQQNITADVNEFSPRLSPDGTAVTYIQESVDGTSTKVHRLSLADAAKDNSDTRGSEVFDFGPVGYYSFLDGGAKAAVFYRSEPGSLYLVDVLSNSSTKLADNIGRGLLSDPGGNKVYFTSPSELGAHMLHSYDWRSSDTARYFELIGGASDYALLFDEQGNPRTVFAASGQKIFMRAFGDAETWTEIADYSASDIGEISRVAVSDDAMWIAFVVADDVMPESILPPDIEADE